MQRKIAFRLLHAASVASLVSMVACSGSPTSVGPTAAGNTLPSISGATTSNAANVHSKRRAHDLPGGVGSITLDASEYIAGGYGATWAPLVTTDLSSISCPNGNPTTCTYVVSSNAQPGYYTEVEQATWYYNDNGTIVQEQANVSWILGVSQPPPSYGPLKIWPPGNQINYPRNGYALNGKGCSANNQPWVKYFANQTDPDIVIADNTALGTDSSGCEQVNGQPVNANKQASVHIHETNYSGAFTLSETGTCGNLSAPQWQNGKNHGPDAYLIMHGQAQTNNEKCSVTVFGADNNYINVWLDPGT